MPYLVTLNLGKGSLVDGFASVTGQLWPPQAIAPMQRIAALPPAPEVATTYQHWRQLYIALYTGMGWRRSSLATHPGLPEHPDPKDVANTFDIEEADVTVGSRSEFSALCQTLQEQFNNWLASAPFRRLEQWLRTQLPPDADIRLIVTADQDSALRLPWHLWELLDDYPRAELALSPANFGQRVEPAASQTSRRSPTKLHSKVQILAILGDRRGIDLAADCQFLQQLPHSDITFLVEPDRVTVSEHLWQGGWDILFFAGHSSSQERGHLQINPQEQLSIEQVTYGLQAAIQTGLKLAIFNSCDGLGLAHTLAELHLPHSIVMREPVPDRVAQEFLKSFLAAFSSGQSLYTAVRRARERLQSWADAFPCATWLPVICQNPADGVPFWHDWYRQPFIRWQWPQKVDMAAIALSSLIATGIVAGVRGLGLLQPLELAAFDQFMRYRPTELPDPRLLIVRITETDIRAEGQAMRQGSLSDQTLSRLLATLEQAEPRVVGLDLYRDFAASPELIAHLEHDRLIAVCKRPEAEADPAGVLPPPEVDPARLGFSDLLHDRDSAVRRHLLFTSPQSAAVCATPYAFSVQLAFRYLHEQGITPQFTPDQHLQLGEVVFPALRSRSAGYQPLDARGSQLLINYRAAPTLAAVAQQVTVAQVLQGEVPPELVHDRIVLIGVDTPSAGDRWSTPYGRSFESKIPGVVLHAQLTSQLLSATLDGRPLLRVWHPGMELLWIGLWAVVGGAVAWNRGSGTQRLSVLLGVVLINGSLCFLLLVQGSWVACVPAIAVVWLSYALGRSPLASTVVTRLSHYSRNHPHV